MKRREKEQCTETDVKIAQSQGEISNLRASLDKAQNEIGHLQKMIKDYQAKHAKIQAELDNVKLQGDCTTTKKELENQVKV